MQGRKHGDVRLGDWVISHRGHLCDVGETVTARPLLPLQQDDESTTTLKAETLETKGALAAAQLDADVNFLRKQMEQVNQAKHKNKCMVARLTATDIQLKCPLLHCNSARLHQQSVGCR